MDYVTSDQEQQEAIKNDKLIFDGGIKCKWVNWAIRLHIFFLS